MSQIHVDPEELAEQFGYKRGYQECQSEMSSKIKDILRLYLYSDKYMSAWTMAERIGKVLDGE